MQKKISSWFKTFPPDYRKLALSSFKSQERDDYQVESLSQAIIWGLNWAVTPEGSNFWADVHKHAQVIEKMQNRFPQIPTKK